MELGLLLSYQKDRRQLGLNGFIRQSIMQMGLLSGTKHVWLLKGLTSDQVRTTLKPLHQLCVKPLCALCWLWLQLRTWNYALWIYPMHSPIVILMRKFTWNSQRDLSKVEKDM